MNPLFCKKYDMFDVALDYARAGSEFFLNKTPKISVDLYVDVFRYSIFTIYEVPTSERSMKVWRVGDKLVDWLKKTRGTPKNIEKIGYEDRMKLAIISVEYFEKMFSMVFIKKEGVVDGSTYSKV